MNLIGEKEGDEKDVIGNGTTIKYKGAHQMKSGTNIQK